MIRRGITTLSHPKLLLLAAPLLMTLLASSSEEPTIRVAPMDSVGPRIIEKQTQGSVVRDYLLAWKSLAKSMSTNRPDLLDDYFVGIARDKLANSIAGQQKLGIQTQYQDRAHHVQVIFYSPEGLSIQLLDDVEYDVELTDHGKTIATQHVKALYLAVLTPTESKWKVRVLQSQSPEDTATP